VTRHRRTDPYARGREEARALARAEPRNARLHGARSLLAYLPWVLLYPLYPELLVLVVLLGAALWLSFASLLGLWLGVPLLAGLLAYLMEIVQASANGRATAPVYTAAHLSRMPLLAFEALLLFALAICTVFVAGHAEAAWIGGVALVGVGLLVPAAFVLLGLEGSLEPALDPRNLVALIAGGGGAYLMVALVCMALLWFAPELLPAAPKATELATGRASAGPLFAVGVVYGAFAAAHLLGAMVYLRREALGLRVTLAGRSAEEEAHETLQESVARCWTQVDAALMAEDDAAAERLVRTHPFSAHPPHPWLEAMFEAALARPKPFLIIAAGERLLAELIAQKRWPRALEVYVHAGERWARFQPAAPAERVQLATIAFERGHALAFTRLTEHLAEAGPAAAELRFLAARWRAERDGDETAAKLLLAPLLQTEGPLRQKAAAYLAALDVTSTP
jgi:hypothetical protein